MGRIFERVAERTSFLAAVTAYFEALDKPLPQGGVATPKRAIDEAATAAGWTNRRTRSALEGLFRAHAERIDARAGRGRGWE